MLFKLDYPQINLRKVPGFRYSGGKYELRKYIARFCPAKCENYCEPFVGRANMFFLLKTLFDYRSWFLNDYYTTPFLRSVRDYDGRKFEWPTEEEYKRNVLAGDKWMMFMEPALFWSGMAMVIRDGKGEKERTTSFVLNHEGSKIKNPSTYRKVALRAQKLLRDPTVMLTDHDANYWILTLGGCSENFLYLDPPYQGADVHSYHDGMWNRKQGIKLLKKAKCKWLLSEYYCQDLVEAFGEPQEKIYVHKKAMVHRGVKKVKIVAECLWANYDLKPMPIQYGDYDPPRNTSLRIIQAAGRLTKNRFAYHTPQCWDKEKIISEFKKLCNFPQCYFNGKEVRWL